MNILYTSKYNHDEIIDPNNIPTIEVYTVRQNLGYTILTLGLVTRLSTDPRTATDIAAIIARDIKTSCNEISLHRSENV